MWKFVGSCGHTVDGWIAQVEGHLSTDHQPGESFQWQMFNPATDELVDTFTWPMA